MDFLDQVLLSNSIRNYVIAGGIIVCILLLRKILSRFVASALFWLFLAAGKKIDKIKSVSKPERTKKPCQKSGGVWLNLLEAL